MSTRLHGSPPVRAPQAQAASEHWLGEAAQRVQERPEATAPHPWSWRRRPTPAGGPRGRVLLAEDDPDMRQLLARALRADGHTVVELRDGAELLQVLHATLRQGTEHGVAAIVSDVRMPACSGLEVLKDLRSLSAELPVVLITAFGSAQTHAAARALGAVTVLDKPFDVDDLRTVLLNLVPPGTGPAAE